MATVIISLVTFAAGLVIGHWLVIGRDKRKEFNEAARPIRVFLLGRQEALSPTDDQPSASEWDAFESCLSRWQRAQFMEARKEHDGYHTGTCAYGMVPYPDPGQVHSCVRALLAFTERRWSDSRQVLVKPVVPVYERLLVPELVGLNRA